MKFKVSAEMRSLFHVGTFDAANANGAMEMAQQTHRYHALSRMEGMGGVHELHATVDSSEPAKESP